METYYSTSTTESTTTIQYYSTRIAQGTPSNYSKEVLTFEVVGFNKTRTMPWARTDDQKRTVKVPAPK